ncbi:hypothetical protein HID58_046897 [Brassica napus]|uniref:BnaCnng56630D protein n=4 Tax=Brassica TaxID=3705 RepID=A0A078JQA8_BRANA|nr:PREDICTED: uncharacterized protein LOC106327774 [Brassica oleracea var. oleracea]XP_013621477.1 PREDICTED: uncharacterized protein LOC106327774 [Brassica oleracea var. oleracea]XP_013621478.1 PREDICTED: uncharacterized protein LOC106327774 [Brassica oleracea var. oleracea]XP_013689354.1 uncharacterized protein BNACNNG56630D [Brassica napus]XP_013689360.1 uncharacterized protein BNACNNG56630D [Brassica napus]XP_013689367.1 uncharacterized protein BNACNNG56630D [Brassica napus]VDD22304.1 unn
MNQWAIQPKAFAAGGEQSVVVCPKPRRIGLGNHLHHPSSRSLRCYFSQQVESKAETDILDIILTKEQVNHSQVLDSPSPFLCGSPPSRVANPLTQDARFRDEIKLVSSSPITTPLGQPPSSPSSSGRKGGCVRGNFGNSPAVRIEGFDCLDRDSRNCSIPALA